MATTTCSRISLQAVQYAVVSSPALVESTLISKKKSWSSRPAPAARAVFLIFQYFRGFNYCFVRIKAVMCRKRWLQVRFLGQLRTGPEPVSADDATTPATKRSVWSE